MGLIKRLFGNSSHAGEDKVDPAPHSQPDVRGPESRLDSRPMEIDAQVGTRRELLRVLTRDTQRYAGMPDGWIEAQVLLELGRDGQTLMHLRLVLRKWDENLLRYHLSFQRRLLAEVERFDPGARDWLLSVTWQYLVDDNAECLDLPDPATWGSPLAALPKSAPGPVTEAGSAKSPVRDSGDSVEEDLARLFAVRDAHMGTADSVRQAGPAPQAAPRDPGPDKYYKKV